VNYPRLALAAVVAWIVSVGLAVLVHGVLLADLYTAHAPLFRAGSDMSLGLGFGAQLFGFFVFAYMYAKGYEGTNGLQEGLRFGVLVGLLLIAFSVAPSYVLLPVSGRLGVAWAVDAVVEMAIYGIIVGLIYRPRRAAARLATT
jgi:hypothetical protein